MSEFEGNDEEVPRTAPKPTAEQVQPPTGPVVPEVSIVMDDRRPHLYREWDNASHPVIATERTVDEIPGISPHHPPLPQRISKRNPKPSQYATALRPLECMTPPQGGARIYHFKNPTQLRPHSFPPPTNRCQYFPPPHYVTMTDIKQFSDNTAKMLKDHQEQIAELKAVIDKVAADVADLKISESVEHKTTQKMLQELQLRYELAGKSTPHSLGPEITSGGGVRNPETQRDKSPVVILPKKGEGVASDAGEKCTGADQDQGRIIQKSPNTIQKSTGAIRKRNNKIPLTGKESADLNAKILQDPQPQDDADSYNILSGLPPIARPKSHPPEDKSMAMRELTYKYVPKEKLQQWDMVKEHGKADVSIATRRYMEKYGLIGPTPQEKDEERPTDPRTGDHSDKILDAATIKNQPKFM